MHVCLVDVIQCIPLLTSKFFCEMQDWIHSECTEHIATEREREREREERSEGSIRCIVMCNKEGKEKERMKRQISVTLEVTIIVADYHAIAHY